MAATPPMVVACTDAADRFGGHPVSVPDPDSCPWHRYWFPPEKNRSGKRGPFSVARFKGSSLRFVRLFRILSEYDVSCHFLINRKIAFGVFFIIIIIIAAIFIRAVLFGRAFIVIRFFTFFAQIIISIPRIGNGIVKNCFIAFGFIFRNEDLTAENRTYRYYI